METPCKHVGLQIGKAMLNLEMDVKGNRRGFYKYRKGKRKTKENMGPVLHEARDLVTRDVEKAVGMNTTFTSVYIRHSSLQVS